MYFLEKLWKIWENIDILNLSQQKQRQTIWYQNQIMTLQESIHRKFIGNINEKNRDTYK